jgi:hypothetical protein
MDCSTAVMAASIFLATTAISLKEEFATDPEMASFANSSSEAAATDQALASFGADSTAQMNAIDQTDSIGPMVDLASTYSGYSRPSIRAELVVDYSIEAGTMVVVIITADIRGVLMERHLEI